MSGVNSYRGGLTSGASRGGKVGKAGKTGTAAPSRGMAQSEPKHGIKDAKELFLKKVQMCSVTYDYSDDNKDVKNKSERLAALQELKEFLSDTRNVAQYVIPHLDLVMDMIQKNIFRPLPMDKKGADKLGPSEAGVEEEDIVIDPAWPHIQGVYEFFFELIITEATDVRSLKVYITPSFVQEFLQLFDSEEPRERDYLKNILHRLYAKLVPRRKMIRKAINDCFLTMIHETHRFNGASELLDILASIISGFAVPLREEHVIFFKNIMIPLHKVQTSHLFHEPLLRCSMLFLSKDHSLAIPLVEGLLRYWPFGNSPKETLFLTELQEVLEVCELAKLEQLIPKLFKRLVKCISGPQLQVADRAMCFFENDYFLGILRTFKQVTFPMVVPVIVELAETHWHKILQESLNALKVILKEIDPVAFERALQSGSRDVAKNNPLNSMHHLPTRANTEAKWQALTAKAKTIDPNFKVPSVPYVDTHVVGLNNMNGLALTSNNLIPPI
jgi:serine/threonine-protein phosphatase 2A regulatory subunit B'